MTDSGTADSVTVTAKIEGDNAGEPDGVAIGTITSQIDTFAGSQTKTITYTFASPVPIDPSTVYHIVLEGEDVDSNTSVGHSNTGGQGTNISVDSGSSWSANNGALVHEVFEIDTVLNRIHQADASISNARANNFLGFCT